VITKIEKKGNDFLLVIPPEIAKLYDIEPKNRVPIRITENSKSIVFCASVPK